MFRGVGEQPAIAGRHAERRAQHAIAVGRRLLARLQLAPAGEQDDRLAGLVAARPRIAVRQVEPGARAESEQQAIGEFDHADAALVGFEDVARLDLHALAGQQHGRSAQQPQRAFGQRDRAGLRRTERGVQDEQYGSGNAEQPGNHGAAVLSADCAGRRIGPAIVVILATQCPIVSGRAAGINRTLGLEPND
ncbi:MAG: hypothetical protein IPL03_17755 [Sterolibacteriaceae bacterium]|nr:hypothetical protein [Candidatus Methylophosphatis haderslevensis]